MRATARSRGTVLAASVLASALALGQGLALAGPEEDESLRGRVSKLTGGKEQHREQPAPESEPQEHPEEPAQEGEAESREASATEADGGGGGTSAEAGGTTVRVRVAGQDVVEVGRTEAKSGGGSSSGDVTILAVGGNKILGAESSSDGPQHDRFHLLEPVCEASDDEVCLGLLYAETSSDPDGSDARSSLLFACVGGSGGGWTGTCDGPVGFEVGGNHSRAEGGDDAGASHRGDLLRACVGPEGDRDGTCSGAGARVFHVDSSSDASGASEGRASLLILEAEGEEVLSLEDRHEVPPGCPADPGSAVCAVANHAEDLAPIGNLQRVLGARTLGGLLGADVVEGFTRIWVPQAVGAEVSEDPHPEVLGGPVLRADPAPSPGTTPGLAFTGFGVAVPLAVVLLFVLGGAAAVRWSDRSRDVLG